MAGEGASADPEVIDKFPRQELLDCAPEELTKGASVGMRASGPVPHKEDVEEAGPENKLTLDSLAEGFRLFKTGFDFFYDMDPL